MSATTIPTHPRRHDISASDGFGLLAAPPLQRRRPAAPCFCLDATTYWRPATPPIESPQPNGVRAAREARGVPL